jgi:hypothetical protein
MQTHGTLKKSEALEYFEFVKIYNFMRTSDKHHHHHHHHHWLDSPVWTLAFFRSFRQSPADCCFFSFPEKNFLQLGVVSPTPNPQRSWRPNGFCQGCFP